MLKRSCDFSQTGRPSAGESVNRPSILEIIARSHVRFLVRWLLGARGAGRGPY
jgi:hypothetical protein